MQGRLLPVLVGLVALAVAATMMEISGTAFFDPRVFRIGLVTATSAGAFMGFVISRIRTPRRHAAQISVAILVVGAIVGIVLQAMMLSHTEIDFGVVARGGALGMIPAALVAVATYAAHRMASPVPAHDASIRVLVPFAGVTAFVSAVAIGFARAEELAVAGTLFGAAILSLATVLLVDHRRVRWLADLFAGKTAYEVVDDPRAPSFPEVPLVVSAVFPRAFVMQSAGNVDYRNVARTPWARLAPTLGETIAPIRKRRTLVLQLVAGTMACAGLSAFLR